MLGLWLSKLQIRKCQREAFKFCLSPEIRHLSTVQIRFCGTKICNQNALPALLCLSHLSVSKDNCLLFHFQKITSVEGGGGGGGDIAKHILHKSCYESTCRLLLTYFRMKCLWELCNVQKLMLSLCMK